MISEYIMIVCLRESSYVVLILDFWTSKLGHVIEIIYITHQTERILRWDSKLLKTPDRGVLCLCFYRFLISFQESDRIRERLIMLGASKVRPRLVRLRKLRTKASDLTKKRRPMKVMA